MSMSEQTANYLVTVAENQQKVYNAGYENGKAEGGEFIGVKYSNFEETGYGLPRTADARSLAKMFVDTGWATNFGFIFNGLFSNADIVYNGGIFTHLETVYLPDKITRISSTFYNCCSLKNIIGDLSSVASLQYAFYNCGQLTEIPYMPNLTHLYQQVFCNCTGLTSFTFYKILTTWVSSAFQGCTNIETINLVDGWNTAVYVQYCTNLTQACLHDMCEKFADMTGKKPLKVYFGETNIEKIDDEHIAMLENKNVDFS